MAVHFKFKSSTAVRSVPVAEPFISLSMLKDRIAGLKMYGHGRDGDLAVYDSSTGLEIDEDTPIARNSLVLIRRIPRVTGNPIIVEDLSKLNPVNVEQQDTTAHRISMVDEKSAAKLHDEVDFNDFGDIFDAPAGERADQNLQVSTKPDASDNEDAKVKAMIETSAIDWQSQISNAYPYSNKWHRRSYHAPHFGKSYPAPHFGAKMYENMTPPPGYVCHRCKVPGHFIKFCPTNGDQAFDIKKPPCLPTAPTTVFEKEMGWRQTSAVNIADLPPELNCPICKNMMRDAVLASKCCFSSFCDACIRDHIVLKSMCFCGSKHGSADDLIPNLTLRETISNMLASRSCITSDSSGSHTKQERLDAFHGKPDQGEKNNESGDNASATTKQESAIVMCSSEAKVNVDDADDCISDKQACNVLKDCGQTAIPEIIDETESKRKVDADSPTIFVNEAKVKAAPVDHGIKSKRQKNIVQEGISTGFFATPNSYAMHGAQFYPGTSYSMFGMPLNYEAYMANMAYLGGYPACVNTPYSSANIHGYPIDHSQAALPKHQPHYTVAVEHRQEVQRTSKHADSSCFASNKNEHHETSSEHRSWHDVNRGRNSERQHGMRSHDRSPSRDVGGRKRTRRSPSMNEYCDDRHSVERSAHCISRHRAGEERVGRSHSRHDMLQTKHASSRRRVR